MSLQSTESFIAFKPVVSDDAYTPANTAIINATTANLKAAGYDVITGANTSAVTSGGWVTRADPIVPDRVALVHSAATGAAASTGSVSAHVRKKLGVSQKNIIGGFSLFVPAEYVASPIGAVVPVLTVTASPSSLTTWNASEEIFRVSSDLSIRYGTAAPLSSKQVVPGRINFFEYRLTDTEIRVWLDDTLVLQAVVQVIRDAVAINMFNGGAVNGSSGVSGVPGRWAIGNWYNLLEDEIYPNVRLGPSTRIIGSRPTADVVAEFVRPAGAPSNASVARQDIVANPTQSLQASAPGVQDVYTGTDTATSTASMVHAVAVRVMAASLDATPHTLRPIIRTAAGTDAIAARGLTFGALPPLPVGDTIRAMDVRPTDKRIFAVGDGSSVWMTPPNGDGTSWTKVRGDASAVICTHIRFRPDGTGLIGLSDGRFYTLAPGSETPVLVTPTGSIAACSGMTVTPAGTFITACALTGTNYTRRITDVNAATYQLVALNPLAASPIVGIACARDGRIVLTTNATNAAINVAYSVNDGVSYATSNRAAGLPANSFGCDGTTFFASGYYPGYDAKSTDGITWTTWVPAPSVAAGSNLQPDFLRGDETTPGGGGMVACAGNGAVIRWVKENSTPYQTANPLAPARYFGAAYLGNGVWIFGGLNGNLARFRPEPQDVNLPGFSGFLPTFNVAVINPDTGAMFTPAEAAATQFGMRATS